MKPFVLIVDDSLTVRMALRQAFARANFVAVACGTLLMARQVLKSRGCDLAVLDLMLPDGNGAELLREMKKDPELRHIPVIVLSATASSAATTSEPPLGAESYIDKPYNPLQLVELAQALCSAQMGGRRFLIVDDSPTFAAALATQLREQGNQVLLAATGEEALTLLEHQTVDCVVIDMIMPGIGGLETCRRLRQLAGKHDLAIVMMTASQNPSGRSQRDAVGADAFLLKSPHLDRLCAQLRALLRKKLQPAGS